MLDQAFEALKTYDWGVDPNVLAPIDDAIVATHGDTPARKELEGRLTAILAENAPRDAKDYVCRQLKVIGASDSVPALAALLSDAELSHMARYALESMPASEAGEALRNAVGETSGLQKAGVFSSLGVRKDAECVAALSESLAGDDEMVAQAAAQSLGSIGTSAAAQALAKAKPTSEVVKVAATDASLLCAESLLESGDKAGALAIYKQLASGDQPKHVRLAATRGMLATRS